MAAGRLFLRLALIGTAVVLVVVLAVAGLTVRLFLWPPSASPRQADAVVILSGDYGGRIIEARRLMGRHVAPVIVFAGTVDTDPLRDLCAGRLPYEDICVNPVPDSTRQEARAVARLGVEHRWKKIAVVTSSYHVTRAGLLLRRCFRGDVQMVAAKEDFTLSFRLHEALHEWQGLLYAEAVSRGC